MPVRASVRYEVMLASGGNRPRTASQSDGHEGLLLGHSGRPEFI
ncbi:MAG: hypothetical protein ABIN99_04325 [Nitrosospira sp.]